MAACRHAGRALGTLLAGSRGRGRHGGRRSLAFSTLGVLLDCGHNATVTSEHLRKWLRRLALLGFDTAMVYTEAGYSLRTSPASATCGEPTPARSCATWMPYAAGLGIELVGGDPGTRPPGADAKWAPLRGRARRTEHLSWWAGEPRLSTGGEDGCALGRGLPLPTVAPGHGRDLRPRSRPLARPARLSELA